MPVSAAGSGKTGFRLNQTQGRRRRPRDAAPTGANGGRHPCGASNVLPRYGTTLTESIPWTAMPSTVLPSKTALVSVSLNCKASVIT